MSYFKCFETAKYFGKYALNILEFRVSLKHKGSVYNYENRLNE
ncbi:hypothetical protein [Croceibacter atlanticus]|nr:hypothetical protein [Croceibacter atlanticus]